MRFTTLLFCIFLSTFAIAQNISNSKRPLNNSGINGTIMGDGNGSGMMTDGTNKYSWGRDSTHTQKVDIPEGFFQWSLDHRLGEIIPQESDTIMYGFQNLNNTDGLTGQYSHLANLGSPRLTRLYFDRNHLNDAYIIPLQYDFLRPDLSTFRFWNTKSPLTNLSYHSAGDSELGEDHLRANFATNINKLAGLGFLLDYTYGRGYYTGQGNSLFNGSVYGYYHGDKYSMHAWISANHFKTAENGGIESDTYITSPESFDRNITSSEIPTVLSSNWNRNDDQTYYLSHRYNVGFYRDADLPDTVNVDSLLANDSTFVIPQKFVPVTSFIHTLQVRHLRHVHYGKREPNGYYKENLYGELGKTQDNQYNTNIRNTIGVSLREGFQKWAKAGLTAFATHDYNIYHIPGMGNEESPHTVMRYVENDVSVGGTLSRTQGSALHFNVTGEAVLLGDNLGNFNVDGTINLNFPLFRDTCHLEARGCIANSNPSFFWRHWHSQHAYWDKDLNKEFRSRVEGVFSIDRSHTRLRIGWENISNYTYLSTTLTPTESSMPLHSYSVKQCGSAIQVLTAQLNQNFKLGILHWDNEVAWQKSSNETALPLPTISLYTNLYLHFRIAKILRIDLGADMRYWTEYYAPDYAPVLNQFTTQDTEQRIKTGGHPVINCYVNAQMKRIRFYVSANHVNAGSGNAFYAPHYPINPMNIHFGLSWNFVN